MLGNNKNKIITAIFILGIVLGYTFESYTENINDKTSDNSSCEKLVEFSKEGKNEEVLRLLKSGVDINCKNLSKEAPLIAAMRKRHFELASILIENGADINEEYLGFTPLNLAILYDFDNNMKIKMVNLLLKKGANPNYNNKKCIMNTPLAIAIIKEDFIIMQILIDHGTDINSKDSDNETYIKFAAFYGKIDVLEFLLKNKFQVTEDNIGSAFSTAVFKKQMKTMEYLLNNFNKLITNSEWYCGSLAQSAIRGDSEVVNFLLDKGVFVDCRTGNGKTALMVASEHGPVESVDLLLKRGANINEQNDVGLTPLMLAVIALEYNRFPTVRYLVEHGANINLTDKNNETALTKAIKNNDIEIINYLQSLKK
jgi:ankyrin repeat protein